MYHQDEVSPPLWWEAVTACLSWAVPAVSKQEPGLLSSSVYIEKCGKEGLAREASSHGSFTGACGCFTFTGKALYLKGKNSTRTQVDKASYRDRKSHDERLIAFSSLSPCLALQPYSYSY